MTVKNCFIFCLCYDCQYDRLHATCISENSSKSLSSLCIHTPPCNLSLYYESMSCTLRLRESKFLGEIRDVLQHMLHHRKRFMPGKE